MKARITITLERESVAWLDSNIDRRVFANRSHGLEFLIRQKMDEEQE